MATMATKVVSANSQKEGTRITYVSEQGEAEVYGGEVIAVTGGFVVTNTRWAARSMGNGGAVS
jgi:hypothetical protein